MTALQIELSADPFCEFSATFMVRSLKGMALERFPYLADNFLENEGQSRFPGKRSSVGEILIPYFRLGFIGRINSCWGIDRVQHEEGSSSVFACNLIQPSLSPIDSRVSHYHDYMGEEMRKESAPYL